MKLILSNTHGKQTLRRALVLLKENRLPVYNPDWAARASRRLSVTLMPNNASFNYNKKERNKICVSPVNLCDFLEFLNSPSRQNPPPLLWEFLCQLSNSVNSQTSYFSLHWNLIVKTNSEFWQTLQFCVTCNKFVEFFWKAN